MHCVLIFEDSECHSGHHTEATAKLPPTDEDMFGQYVASQLKLLDAKTKLHIKVQINNMFLNEQLNEMENVNPLNQQFNVPSFSKSTTPW